MICDCTSSSLTDVRALKHLLFWHAVPGTATPRRGCSDIEVGLLGGRAHFFELLQDAGIVLIKVAFQAGDRCWVNVQHLHTAAPLRFPANLLETRLLTN